MQSFHCFGKSKIQMHVPAMRHELCHFSDSKYMLNDVIFAIKTGIEKNHWDCIRINGKGHAKN